MNNGFQSQLKDAFGNPFSQAYGPSQSSTGVSSPTTPVTSYLSQLPSNTPSNSATPQNVMADQPKKESGSLWSTIGGIALPVLGALLAPETGGLSLLGGLAGGAALSGVGSAAGKAIDNAVAGQNPFQMNDLTSGLESAAGSAVGGAVLGKLGKMILPKAASVAGNTGEALLQGQGKGALDNATAKYLFKNGVTNLNQVGEITPLVTGSEGAVSNGVKNILYNANDSGITSNLLRYGRAGTNLPGEAVNQHAVAAGLGKGTQGANNVQDFVENVLQQHNPMAITQVPAKGGKMLSSFDNGVLNNQSPSNVLSITQKLDAQASKWMTSRSPDIQAQGKALSTLSNEMKDSLYGAGSEVGNIGITPVMRQQIIDDLAPLKEVNPTYYAAKVQEINNANNLADLRSLQKPDVMAGQALEGAQNIAGKTAGKTVSDIMPIGGGAVGFGLGGLPGALTGYTLGKVAESAPAQVVATGLLSKLSNKLGSKQAQNIVSTLGKAQGVLGASALGAGTPTAAALPTVAGGVGTNQGDNTMNGNQNSIQDTLALMLRHPFVYGNQIGSTMSALEPQLQKNQAVQNAVNAIEQQYQTAGGAQGLGQGLLSQLQSFIPGTAQNAYSGSSQTLAAQLADALGMKDSSAIQNLLPSLMQSPEVAAQRLQVLRNMAGGMPTGF